MYTEDIILDIEDRFFCKVENLYKSNDGDIIIAYKFDPHEYDYDTHEYMVFKITEMDVIWLYSFKGKEIYFKGMEQIYPKS